MSVSTTGGKLAGSTVTMSWQSSREAMNSLMENTMSSGCPPGGMRWASSGGTSAGGRGAFEGISLL